MNAAGGKPMFDIDSDLMSLEQFLRFPEVKPPFEYYGGRAVQKMSPSRPHGALQMCFGADLLEFVRLNNLGRIYSELRCTFGGGSYIPDLCFIATGRIPRNSKGELVSKIKFAPDLAIEILSPGQTVGELRVKLRFAIRHGLRMGWLIHPVKKQIYILRPRHRVEIIRLGGTLTGEDVLPGYTLSLDKLFSWQAED
jgi:Uma2 family endonuclease